jgi:hypothetical protein
LKWDKENETKGKHSKFQNMCLGPFQVDEKIKAGTYLLKNMKGESDTFPVNGHALNNSFPIKKNIF